MVADWRALGDELDAWAATGRIVDLWWRDDDATDTTAPLARLIDLVGTAEVPLCLAVIPAQATTALAVSIGDAPVGVVAVPHGYTHRNHAPRGQRKSEFPPQRARTEMIAELERVWSLTAERFGARALPVLVPPWNRIADDLLPGLPAAGFRGISAIASSKRVPPDVAGLRRRDAHVDIIDWRGSRRFIGEAAALEKILGRLATVRKSAGVAPPLGLLTHHLMNDVAAWAFLGKFAALTRGHGSVRWPSVAKIFTL